MMEAVPCQNDVEFIRVKGESSRVADVPRQVCKTQLRLAGRGKFDHVGSQINPGDLTCLPCSGTCDGTGSAGDVQDPINISYVSQSKEQLRCFIVAGQLNKERSLLGKLIDNLSRMLIHFLKPLLMRSYRLVVDFPSISLFHISPRASDRHGCSPLHDVDIRLAACTMGGSRAASRICIF